MDSKKQQILNKYDIHNVESKLNEFFNDTVTQQLKCSKVAFHEYFKLVFGLAFSAVILLSYFHKTPFPQDKPQIALCVILYALMNFIMNMYTKFRLKNAFSEFAVNSDALVGQFSNLKGLADGSQLILKLKSKVTDFSNKYTLAAIAGNKEASETIDYNQYIDEQGFVVEEEAKKLLFRVLKAL